MEELQEHTNKKSPKRKLAKKKPKYKPFQNLSKDKDMLKFSYADLKLPSPKEFNYDNYNRVSFPISFSFSFSFFFGRLKDIYASAYFFLLIKDWCRYCGARFSSNFTKGPWGPRTLCTVLFFMF